MGIMFSSGPLLVAGTEENWPSPIRPSSKGLHGEASTGCEGICWRGHDGQRPFPQVRQWRRWTSG